MNRAHGICAKLIGAPALQIRLRDAIQHRVAPLMLSSSRHRALAPGKILQASYSTDRSSDLEAKSTAATKTNKRFVLPDTYASIARRILSRFLPRYQGPAIGRAVYSACSCYPDFKEFWIEECRLPESFQTWFSTTSFYVWMAMVRVRADPNAKHYNQGIVDSFFQDAELRIRASGIKSGRIVNDTLKDLVSSFKGTVMSLDEGFARSDAALAAAVWRNILPVDDAVLQIDAIVIYARAQLQILDSYDISKITTGQFAFGPVSADKH
ncbi:Serine carboxypeptidase 3 [Coemansia guatemalensis]|uniref:Serine carboxypeptidase 3 n=1 Tax=Coemansia guatemalensis TaxID=2761395 RepID=A0A9W8HUW8_9FUNG|nr:Serine carboxypeptidase 3 [Coemansia guatemalensis]